MKLVMGMKYYLCIDLKSFYASVECVERGIDPLTSNLVVADNSRGNGTICLAVTPNMKKLGVKNRCRLYEIPDNISYIVAKPRMKKYMEYSRKIYSVYLKYVSYSDIHVYSIDEAFLDVTSYLKLYGNNILKLVKMILSDIFKTTGITATCGIGTNMYLAKIALDIISKHSPTNIGYLDEKLYIEKLGNYKKLDDFWMISSGTIRRLYKHNLYCMNDISKCDERILYKEFGINARLLIDHSKGIETCTISDIKNYKPKNRSISSSQILFHDYDFYKARNVLVEMIDNLVLELVSINLYTDNVFLYIGYSKDIEKGVSISRKIDSTNSFKNISSLLVKLYEENVNKNIPIRRIGISFNNVKNNNLKQLDIFNKYIEEDKDNLLLKSINDIKNRFGNNSVLRCISYVDGSNQRMRNKLVGGHNGE